MTDVTYDLRFTRNMGNYESLQVNVGLTDAVKDDETVDEARARVKETVETWLQEDVEDVERDIRGLRSRLDKEESEGK